MQIIGRLNRSLTLGGEQRAKRLVEIVRVRAGENRGAQPCGFERVLTAMRDETPAKERKRRGAIEKPELTERVGDIDLRRRIRQCARGAASRGETLSDCFGFDLNPPRRVARHDHGEHVRCAQLERDVEK